MSKSGLQRTWFVAHLVLLTTFIPVSSFGDAELSVNRVLGLQSSLRLELEKLWTEVMISRERGVAYQEPELFLSPISKIDY
jgi:hypothetical protein